MIDPSENKQKSWRELNDEIVENVTSTVQYLQSASAQNSPQAVARLAQLRAAVGAAPGSAPAVWTETIGNVPEELLNHDDEPSAAESAIHHAVTLFALHRQGKVTRAHQSRVGIGHALRRLSSHRSGNANEESEGVRRRFDSFMTAVSITESAYHLRGLVTLLRSADIGLDYGYLARDLSQLWTPAIRDTVRLRWARDYRYAGKSEEPKNDKAIQ